uniref:Uncharacterized protein n=1 Tax=Arundo donax TaxID=35708 RepID=A0A0A9B0B9_ARUDO
MHRCCCFSYPLGFDLIGKALNACVTMLHCMFCESLNLLVVVMFTLIIIVVHERIMPY